MLMNDPMMITNDPLIRLHRRQQIWLTIFTVLMGISFFAAIVRPFISGFSISLIAISEILLTGGIFIPAISSFLRGRNTLKHRIQQCQKLGVGNSDLLAYEQPSPYKHALPCPTMITLRPKTSTTRIDYSVLALWVLACTGLAVYGLVGVFTTPYYSIRFDDLIFAAFTGGAALFFAAFLWFSWWSSHNWVKVTEIGLEARFNGHRMHIVWEDARLFIVDGVIGYGQPCIYTLLGKQESVIWKQLTSASQPSSPRPTLPFDQYLQQSKALLAVVAGQTRLPLYDIRRPADTKGT